MTQVNESNQHPVPATERPKPFAPSLAGRWDSFSAAFEGLWHVVRTQPNAWIELAAAAVALSAAWWFGISAIEWAIIVVLIALMLALECVNTALEATVDLAAPHWHPLAKIAKDAAAGALLLMACGSVVVAAIIFLPYLFPQ
jgi:diacylglycerol kinase